METRDISITEFDLRRLTELLEVSIAFRSKDGEHLLALQKELDRARQVKPGGIPADVVTMNLRVRLKFLDKGEERVVTLVFPADADAAQDRISILAPIGTAILGYRATDVLEWRVPAGLRTLRIEEVLYKPEAAGDDHL